MEASVFEQRTDMIRIVISLALTVIAAQERALAGLAITEVMSQAVRSASRDFVGPDFWELTNFGTEAVDVRGYSFGDNSVLPHLETRSAFANLNPIRPGESVILSERTTHVASREEFIAWWGAENLPPDLQVGFWDRPPGFSSGGDEVWLYDADLALVDFVVFGEAHTGRTFTYDPATGEFGYLSTPQEFGAFKAARTDDVGSPGVTSGPIEQGILAPPLSQTVDGCGEVFLEVLAKGMPRPSYQWFKNGEVLLGATSPFLVLEDARLAAGEYHVVLRQLMQELASPLARITVNTNPLAPVLIAPPRSLSACPDQFPEFCVQARGYPCVEFQWQMDGQNLPGATNRCVKIPTQGLAYGEHHLTVRISNREGTTNAHAVLRVTPWPKLIVTEVMAWPKNALFSGNGDWFELTNYDTNAVSLQGYRIRDLPTLANAFVITDPIQIEPGESIIFVDGMTPEAFRKWWGATNLPCDLKIITFRGFGFAQQGDTISVWNEAASAARAGSELASSASFARSTEGFSLEFTDLRCPDPDNEGCYSQLPVPSVAGVNGAFVAAESDDVGSPGYVTHPPPPAREPLAPVLIAPPRSLSACPDQIPEFCVQAREDPCLEFQWQMDGQDLPGATNRCVKIVTQGLAYGEHHLTVRISNREGTTNAHAVLRVTPRPKLIVTEVMAWPKNALFSGNGDWFELTNYDTNAVSLQGYRIRDLPILANAFVITDPVQIEPGESIIFVDGMTPDAFRKWWGATNLPCDLKIIAFRGFDFSQEGDTVWLWNAAGEVASSASFPRSTEGFSFEFTDLGCPDPDNESQLPLPSVAGVNGAFVTAESDDVGSPGYVTHPPPPARIRQPASPPRVIRCWPSGDTQPRQMSLECAVMPGYEYRLLAADSLEGAHGDEIARGLWRVVESRWAVASTLTLTDPDAGGAMRFYRILQVPCEQEVQSP
jgi:hypothetical protein